MDGVGGTNGSRTPDDGIVDDRRRTNTLLTAALHLADEPRPRDVRIRNLSERGVMAEVGRAVRIGTATRIVLRGIGEIGGEVVWNVDDRIGIALDRTIDRHLLRACANPAMAPPR